MLNIKVIHIQSLSWIKILKYYDLSKNFGGSCQRPLCLSKLIWFLHTLIMYPNWRLIKKINETINIKCILYVMSVAKRNIEAMQGQ